MPLSPCSCCLVVALCFDDVAFDDVALCFDCMNGALSAYIGISIVAAMIKAPSASLACHEHTVLACECLTA